MKYKAFMDKTRAEQKGKSLDRNEIKAFVFKRKTKKTEVVLGSGKRKNGRKVKHSKKRK